jgi:EAL domain-containing protein (putative c-di-GMP-specific phosphodiesterase class I)
MAKDEWQQPDKIGVHPTLVKLAEKTKKLIELENLLLETVKSDIEKFNENELKKRKE